MFSDDQSSLFATCLLLFAGMLLAVFGSGLTVMELVDRAQAGIVRQTDVHHSSTSKATGANVGKPLPPKARTGKSIGVHATEAVLTGTINPRNQRTIFRFQYGLTKSYGSITPHAVEEEFFGNEERGVDPAIECLRPRTTYHYRVVAKNRSGTTFGLDRTFTTTRRHVRAANNEFC